jgi:hypothetical protein
MDPDFPLTKLWTSLEIGSRSHFYGAASRPDRGRAEVFALSVQTSAKCWPPFAFHAGPSNDAARERSFHHRRCLAGIRQLRRLPRGR